MGIEPGQFRSSAEEAVNESLRSGEWRVFPHYEAKDGPNGTYVHAPLSYQVDAPEIGEGWSRTEFQWDYPYAGEKSFRPLIDTPALFLEFAGLIEEGEITQDVWLDWVERYGVLGFEGNGRVANSWWGNPRGGPSETLAAFQDAAWQANAVLRVYEAATVQGELEVEVLREFAHKGRPDGPNVEGLIRFEGEDTPAALKEWGLREVHRMADNILAGHCFPELYRLKETFFGGWGFKSLLGAMYLQLLWLVAATGEVRRCQGPGCSRIIAYEQPEPIAPPGSKKNDRSMGYKTRKDKKFCSNRCKNNWRYHYVIKPRKQDAR